MSRRSLGAVGAIILAVPGTLFETYDGGDFFDEVFAGDGTARPHYAALVKRLEELTPDELARRERLLDEAFRLSYRLTTVPSSRVFDAWGIHSGGLAQVGEARSRQLSAGGSGGRRAR